MKTARQVYDAKFHNPHNGQTDTVCLTAEGIELLERSGLKQIGDAVPVAPAETPLYECRLIHPRTGEREVHINQTPARLDALITAGYKPAGPDWKRLLPYSNEALTEQIDRFGTNN